MSRLTRLGAPVLLAVTIGGAAIAQTPAPPRKDLPALRLGALLPVTGPASWYAEEMRQGMELALAEINPRPARPGAAGAPAKDRTTAPAIETDEGAAGRVPRLQVVLEVRDVPPLDLKAAQTDFGRLAAGGAVAVFTASVTPTLTVYPLAGARDILVVHQGPASERLPAASQTLLQLRPGPAARADALVGHARERGVQRLAVLAAGDEFGEAVRDALARRWPARGGTLTHVGGVSLESPDLGRRIREVARLSPEAICLGVRGRELGELARRIREAGYAGLLLGLDDDPAALLAAGPDLGDTELVADAFVPAPDSRGARFARAYEARYKRSPSRFAASAYDAVVMLAEAAGDTLREGGPVPGGARLRASLAVRRTFPSVYGGTLRVRDDGVVERPLALFRVERGRATFVRYVTAAGAGTDAGTPAPASSKP
jgi:branched-chain amino acid transport system substrate-binding protein